MNYVVAIPSHKRAEILRDRTLTLLDKLSISHSRIYVFVSTGNIKTYRDSLPNDITLILGKEGVANNRMFISDYFDESQPIISIDDDVDTIYKLNGSKSIVLDNIDDLIKDTFIELKEKGLGMAGVYPTKNPFYMKPNHTTDLRFCIGQLKFFINDRFCERRKFNLLEDYENTIKYYLKYGGVLRLNNISVNADYNKLAGGMADNTDLSLEAKTIEVEEFSNKYKNYCWIKSTEKRINIRLSSKHKPLTIQTLWIGDKLNELSELAIKSWLNQGYNIILYSDTWKEDDILINPKIEQRDALDIMDFNEISDILPFSDLWRFKLLYKKGGLWLDSDMILLDQIPNDKILISSEYTMNSGAYKSQLPYICNIGVLRFPRHDQILKRIIDKIESNNNTAEFCDNMKIFRKIIKNTEYSKFVKDPSLFCPISWWDAKEFYYDIEYKTKYAVKPLSNDIVLNNSIAVHAWNNFTYNRHCIDFNKIEKHSMYNRLKIIIFDKYKWM